MPDSPLFSLVIPTRNRAHLLRFALKSALAQRFDDYEVLVSDNFSSDDTPAVVEAARCGRVRYVRTPESMCMPDHWEWALQHVRGRFVMFFCDDDGLSPETLNAVNRAIRESGSSVVVLADGCYHYPSWWDEAVRNVFHAPLYSGDSYQCDSRQVLAEMFGRLHFARTPRVNNSFCHRSVIDDVRRRAGRFFLSPSPDHTACAMTLASVSRYTYLDEPLLIFGACEDSIGHNTCYRNKPVIEFMDDFREPLWELSPLHSFCIVNNVAECLLRARAAMPERFQGLEINPVSFYLGCLRELEDLKRHGVDVSEELRALECYRRQQGFHMQIARLGYLARTSISRSRIGPAARAARRVLRARSNGRQTANGHTQRIAGARNGFSNIFECAQRLPHLRETLCSGNGNGWKGRGE